jgi:SAM-dependent methyltransferase
MPLHPYIRAAVSLVRRFWRVLVCGVVLLYVINHTVATAGSGVGGRGFANIAVQCIFKSYASVDAYQKSERRYANVTDVLTNGGRNPNGVSYFSSDFATDKQHRHNYTDYYDIVLAPYFARDVNILEIGVKKGGSLKLWRELFSAKSRVFGIDVDTAVPTFSFDANIKTLTFSSTDGSHEAFSVVRNALQGVQFDIIIDDGLHTRSAQRRTFTNLYKLLKDTGVYIVEDIYHVARFEYKALAPTWDMRLHADKSIEEKVMFIYPEHSIARTTELGRVDFII